MTIFLLTTLVLLLILNLIILFFVYKIFKKNDSINKIHYLISNNNSRIDDTYTIIIRNEKLKNEEIENT